MNNSIDILFSHNLYLVDKVLLKYRPLVYPATLEELEADAMIGLWDAIRLYDPSHHKSFKNYANQKIHYAIKEGLRQRDPLPREFRNHNDDPIEIIDIDEVEEDRPSLVYNDPGIQHFERSEFIESLLKQIDQQLAELLFMRFWLGLTDIQIANRQQLSRKRVARQIQRALDELKNITSQTDAFQCLK
ncbi:MAG TPA: sigma-70 family RNA polymerase sigma factor [Anaerohalosphaeraceae bacterium]|nr:sigma-70 family RNA polymerase sigma factor [Anaerohalosphaeraceae bacterium]HPC64775.1 sigma-70 family RNA polymerase sigma factor [Anaerohalosphaeraceae bacterium]HRS71789.1 sigma-70 family RNA polymerase sigma factor [Anaerohalosphaeraceae bacterium]HRV20821.1 sigma-70 family RNA polymerase sigma factor [Anaerohalosphaeraceae bacterium]